MTAYAANTPAPASTAASAPVVKAPAPSPASSSVKSAPPQTGPSPLTLEQFKAEWRERKLKQRNVPAAEQAAYAGKMQAALQAAGVAANEPQYVLLVDRNPLVQTLFIYAKAGPGPWEMIGAAPVSTGRTGKFDHYLTPLGVFTHSLANPDFRAEGTRNQNGVRGYGLKGMRVWDFGWAVSERGWGTKAPGQIRLQMHATDPAALEARLGQRASKGCVRISTELNRVIDHFGLIDAEYDAAVKQGQKLWVLRKDRQPVANSGRYLVVVDSGVTEKPAWLDAGK